MEPSAQQEEKEKEKEKEKVIAWESMGLSEMLERVDGFVHLTSKVNTTAVKAVGIRLPANKTKEIPYIGLSTVGASFEALDFCEGGAAGVRRPRQIKDQVTGKSSGTEYDRSVAGDEEVDRKVKELSVAVQGLTALMNDSENWRVAVRAVKGMKQRITSVVKVSDTFYTMGTLVESAKAIGHLAGEAQSMLASAQQVMAQAETASQALESMESLRKEAEKAGSEAEKSRDSVDRESFFQKVAELCGVIQTQQLMQKISPLTQSASLVQSFHDLVLRAEDDFLRSKEAVQAVLEKPAEQNTEELHPLLRQILVPDTFSAQFVSLTPLGGVGLSQMFIDELEKERAIRLNALIASEKETDKEKNASIQTFWNSAETSLGGEKPQNVSLLCTVEGGRRRAKFALMFGGPAISNVRSGANFNALYRGISVGLRGEEKEVVKNALLAWDQKVNLRTSNAMQWAIEKQVRMIKARVRTVYDDMIGSFANDLEKHEDLDKAIGGGSAALLKFWGLSLEEQSSHGLGNWSIKTTNAVQKGWLQQTFDDSNWASLAAKHLVETWTKQTGVMLSQSQSQKVISLVMTEIQK